MAHDVIIYKFTKYLRIYHNFKRDKLRILSKIPYQFLKIIKKIIGSNV